jgi:tyrosyl-tRNA synthetase
MVGQRPQQVFLVPMLVGTDGGLKMSKSLGNYIGVDEPAAEMYGKVMSIRDELMVDYFRLVTDVPTVELEEMERALAAGDAHPMDLKRRLAAEIVGQFHGAAQASEAAAGFARVFSGRETPAEIPALRLDVGDEEALDLAGVLVEQGVAASKSEARRLIAQGGVDLDGQPVARGAIMGSRVRDGAILKVGKRHFWRIERSHEGNG